MSDQENMTAGQRKDPLQSDGATEATAAALAEVERLEEQTGLKRLDLTPDDLTAEGERGDLARAVAAYGATFEPAGDGEPTESAKATDTAAAEASAPERVAKEQTGEEAPKGRRSRKASAETAPKPADPAEQGDAGERLEAQLKALGLSPEEIGKVRGNLDAAVKAEVSRITASPEAQTDNPDLSAALARIDALEAKAASGPQINRAASDAAAKARREAMAAQDDLTRRSAMRSAQVYGGLEGGEYALNPADPTNRARVMVGEAPAPADTGAANGTAGASGAGAPAPTQGQLPMPAGVVTGPAGRPLVAGPVTPTAAPAVPGPSKGS